ncbi:hypothetical protein CROQUDRAFT_661203 [Cronartium quercuum f. sp. fusiforme G11]|uniref:Uncharacterized protein n=1 Tax=Cronartium quercuum f. sp. fusiforme G11 TaxID=708437 RepID=A0A9P6NCN5_9BASI|nr:hypothetical protein CROQUDRAFT_661203 [Cronartium quercuum f. sp. fusiforme G11]
MTVSSLSSGDHAEPLLRTHSHAFTVPSISARLPTFVFQFTFMKCSMMIWIGTSSPSESEKLNACLANDWACAVPPSASFRAMSTVLNSTSPSTTFSQSLSTKLAQRFKQQVFVSFDVPTHILELDHTLLLAIEKELFAHTQSILSDAALLPPLGDSVSAS